MEVMVYFTWFIHYVYTPVPYDTSALMKKSWQVGDVKIITLGLLKQKRILILDVVCKQTRQMNKVTRIILHDQVRKNVC